MNDAPAVIPPALEALALVAALPAAAPAGAAAPPFLSFPAELDEALSRALEQMAEPGDVGLAERQTAAAGGSPLPLAPAATGERERPVEPEGGLPVFASVANPWPAVVPPPALAPADDAIEHPEPAVPAATMSGRAPAPPSVTDATPPIPDGLARAETWLEEPASPLPALATPFRNPELPAEGTAVRAAVPSFGSHANATTPGIIAFAQMLPGDAVPSPDRMPPPTPALPLDRPGWEPTLAERVAWQIGERVQSARLELNPPDLGPLEVRVRFEGEQARIHLVADAPSARDALESGVPRLRELLQQAGVALLDVSVERHASGSRASQFYVPPGTGLDPPEAEVVHHAAVGLVDYYA